MSDLLQWSMLPTLFSGLARAKWFFLFCFQQVALLLSPLGWILLTPSKEKNTKQTLSSDFRSNIYSNHEVSGLVSLLLFLQTHTISNRAEKPLFGSSICKIFEISLHWRQYSQFQMQKETVIQGPKEEQICSSFPNHCILPWSRAQSLHGWLRGKSIACVYPSSPVLPRRTKAISPVIRTNPTLGNLI